MFEICSDSKSRVVNSSEFFTWFGVSLAARMQLGCELLGCHVNITKKCFVSQHRPDEGHMAKESITVQKKFPRHTGSLCISFIL